MKTIYKYPLVSPAINAIELPVGAQVLTVQMQGSNPQIWALVDLDEKAVELRKFYIYGTGDQMPDNPGQYIGTFQMKDLGLVWHLFEQSSAL
jgi:hypothetical protein